MNYWLVKSDSETYPWEQFVKDKKTSWDGVRNFQARNNLKLMKKNDKILFYHSVSQPCIVGIAKVVKEFYPDPTAPDQSWVAVDIEPMESLKKPVSLGQIKSELQLQDIALIKQSRLSVMPINPKEYEIIVKMSK